MMSRDEAKEIIEDKILRLENDGINEIPVKTVLIDSFEINNGTFNEDKLFLIGLYRKSNHRDIACNKVCQSYCVQCNVYYYFSSTLLGAFKLIEALRVLKGHKPDERHLAHGIVNLY